MTVCSLHANNWGIWNDVRRENHEHPILRPLGLELHYYSTGKLKLRFLRIENCQYFVLLNWYLLWFYMTIGTIENKCGALGSIFSSVTCKEYFRKGCSGELKCKLLTISRPSTTLQTCKLCQAYLFSTVSHKLRRIFWRAPESKFQYGASIRLL